MLAEAELAATETDDTQSDAEGDGASPELASSEPEAEAAPSWDGELASISEAPWYAGLDPDKAEWIASLPTDVQDKAKAALVNARDGVTAGLRAKHENWEKGWRPKYDANAKKEKDIQAQRASLADDEKRWWKVVRGEEDPAAAIKSDLEAKTATFETEKAALSEQLQKAHDEMKRLDEELTAVKAAREEGDASNGDIAATRKELETARVELTRLQNDAKVRAETESNVLQAAADAAGDELFDWLQSEHGVIVADDKAFDYFNHLIAAETDVEDAVETTYLRFPKLKPKQPEPIEPAVKLMHTGGARPSSVTGEEVDYFEAKRKLVEAAKS